MKHRIKEVLIRDNLYSKARLHQVYHTGIAESAYKTNMSSDGKAFSWWQVEYPTAQSLLCDSLPAFPDHDPIHKSIIALFASTGMRWEQFARIMLNKKNSNAFALQVEFCVLKYKTIPEPLPAWNDLPAQASYWKRHYNTSLGKGSINHFIQEVRNHNEDRQS